MAFIGKNVIENLTTAMYENLLIIYREYIQNAADSIDKAIKTGLIEKNEAEVLIEIDSQSKTISIENNGAGISSKKFLKIMSSIADSQKDSSENKGFRGIGRLGGISACRYLRFSCSANGETVQSVVTWEAQKVREILNDVNQNPDASSLVDQVTAYEEQPCDADSHFFKVELIEVQPNAPELLDEERVKNYLSNVAPLPYANKFLFSSKIHKYAEENDFLLDEYAIYVNGDMLYKPYTTRLYEKNTGSGKKSYDEIIDVKFEIFYAEDGTPLAWMWYGISRFEKQIPDGNAMRGIRLRKGNIQIGNEYTFREHSFYKEPRSDLYFVGEVFAIHPDLRPNARRDYFNINDCCREFEEKLHDLFYDRFNQIYRYANTYKKAYQKKQELVAMEQTYAQKTEDGFISAEEKENLETQIEEQKKTVEKAEKTIKTREEKEEADEILSKVYEAIKQKNQEVSESENITQENKEDSSKKKESPKKNPYKAKKEQFLAGNLSQYTKSERKLIQRIYGVIESMLIYDEAQMVIKKIQEELSK